MRMAHQFLIGFVWTTALGLAAVQENPRDGQQYASIPPGTFMMGCTRGDAECGRGESAPHRVTIAKRFWMGKTEITVAAYRRFAAAQAGKMPPDPEWNPGWQEGPRPIVNVTFGEAGSFCRWAGGRLPSEDEWEYAARAGSEARRYGELNAVAWYGESSGGKGPAVVGQKQANAWGLKDMLGNVWEWTTGLYPLTGQNDGPNLPANRGGPFFALRGGSWSDAARLVRFSVRGRAEAPHRSNSIGARCVLEKL
jgi:formylglycine-generating enzyme required for sulfatase activity